MKRLRITQNRTVKIDDLDYDKFRQCKWFYNTNGYARGTINGKKIYLHRFILPPPIGLETDHINGNKLDNRRANLRHVTRSENNLNRCPVSVDTWLTRKRIRKIQGRKDPRIQAVYEAYK